MYDSSLSLAPIYSVTHGGHIHGRAVQFRAVQFSTYLRTYICDKQKHGTGEGGGGGESVTAKALTPV